MGVFSFLRGHKILKIIGLAIGALLGAFLILMLIVAVQNAWGGYKWQKKADKLQAALEKPYREDTLGGKTPEETWSMFLSALRQGDVEQASKFVAVDKREEEKFFLLNEKQLDNLQLVLKQFSSELKREKDYIQGDNAYYYYKLKDDKTGKVYNNSVVFYLNPFTNVWKILVL